MVTSSNLFFEWRQSKYYLDVADAQSKANEATTSEI